MKKIFSMALFSFSAFIMTFAQASSAPPSLNRVPFYFDQLNKLNEPSCYALTLSCMGSEKYEKFLAWKNEHMKARPGRVHVKARGLEGFSKR